MAITHDDVFTLAMNAGAEWLAEYLFDTAEHTGCNGIHAVADVARNRTEAAAMIEALQHGTLPPGIEVSSAGTQTELGSLWDTYLDIVRDAVEDASVETN